MTIEFLTELIGYMAAVMGTSLMVPQVIHTLKTKKVCDLSFLMLFFYFFNCLLWLIYGALLVAIPIVICNGICLVVSVFMLYLKFRYNKVEYIH